MSEMQATMPQFDQTAAESFAERVAGVIDAGAVTLMISIGHRTGLFDTLAGMRPDTSEAIAEKSGLAERYVREWLAAMVSGGIIRFEPRDRTYRLPPEHAACLTRDAALGNLAVAAQVLPGFGAIESRILECFETGGGTTYGEYPDFHCVMAEDSGQTVVAQLFDTILPLAPGLTEGLEAGIDVLDAGCGRGMALIALAERFPASRFTGYDLGADAIAHATAAVSAKGLSNVRFAAYDMSGFDESGRYDLITSFDAVHDQKDPQALLTAIHRALRPDGTYLMQDIGGSAHLENNADFPMAAYLYTVSCLHCMPVSLGQGGAGLGTMWGWETAEAMLRTAGFSNTQRHVLPHDPMNVWFVNRKA